MIPILYDGNEKNFISNGLGRLSDAISCTVEEERNGTFELEMEYPINGIHFSDIAVNNIILAKTEDGGTNQAFIIYKVSKPLNGIVTVSAQHISYLLNGFVVMPYEAISLADALGKINSYAVLATGFTFSTDIVQNKHFSLDAPRSIRSLLGGESGSLLDVYGGHDYYFNNFTVSLLADRGRDNGVTIRYGKNLTDLKAVSNSTNVYTGIVPYWVDGETGNAVYVDDYVVYSEHAATYPYKYIKPVDFSSDFETAPSKAQLLERAQNYLADNDGWKIKNNIDVSFVSLAQTEEYKDIAPLERVKLCDTVSVEYTKIGISFKTKVIQTVYNVLRERYDSIKLGDATYTLAQAILQANDTPTVQETTNAIRTAVQNATKLIRGGLGGHVVMMADGNGLPQEILIMDTDDIATATKVWRWNLGGLGYSNTGYDGDFGTAITMDGQIVANYITAGVFDGAIIKAGSIAADALSVQAKNALTAKHNFISDKIFTDISVWSHGAVAPTYETIDDTKYLVLDGTGINAWSSNYYISIPTDVMGTIAVDVHMKYHIDRQVVIGALQEFLFLEYVDTGGVTRHLTKYLSAQTIAGNTDYEWTVTFNVSDADYTKKVPVFGIYFIQGCKAYIEELGVTSVLDTYTKASMEFNVDGLKIAMEEVAGTHNYIPYDYLTSTYRYGGRGAFPFPYFSTFDGKTYFTLEADGITTIGDSDYATLPSDFLGQPELNISFKMRFNKQYTCALNEKFFGIQYRDKAGQYHAVNRLWSSVQTFEANTDYSFSFTMTPYYTALYEQKFRFWWHPDVTVYFTDVVIETTEQAYNSAALTVTPQGLSSVVQSGNVISAINQSAESVNISASRINLTGELSLHGDFKSYDANDNTTYAFLDSGNLSFFNAGINVFTIASTAIEGQFAGIFFGNVEDPATIASYTSINQALVRAPEFYQKGDGHYSSKVSGYNYGMVVEDTSYMARIWCDSISIGGQNDGQGGFNYCYSDIQFNATVYDNSSTPVFVSDKRKKRNIKDLAIEKAKSFIMALKPRSFKFTEDISQSNRNHHGFIAQEVKEAMNEDWGVYVLDEKRDFIGLRYDELIADMVAVIQDQEKRIEALERAIHDKSNN